MTSLLKQARAIADQSWWSNSGFIFCNRERAEFHTANFAHTEYDRYAFTIHDNEGITNPSIERLIAAMKVYCWAQELEYVEK